MRRLTPRAVWLSIALLQLPQMGVTASSPLPVLPQPIELTFSMQKNLAFSAAAQEALVKLQTAMNHRLCMPLTAAGLSGPRPANCIAASQSLRGIAHVLVLKDGLLHRIYSTNPRLIEQPASLGSIGKAVLAVPLLAHAGANPLELWCVQAYGDFRNANGFRGETDCLVQGAQISAAKAIGTSNNLALIWRVRQFPAASVREALVQLGIRNVPDSYHPGIAAALGIVEYSPRQAVECFDALISGQATRAALVKKATAGASALAQWCADARHSSRGQHFIDHLLTAAVQPGGTAAALVGNFPKASGLRAKTGTAANASDLDTGKVVVGSLVRSGHRYTFFVALLSPSASVPLAPALHLSDLRGLLNLVQLDIGDQSAPVAPKNPWRK